MSEGTQTSPQGGEGGQGGGVDVSALTKEVKTLTTQLGKANTDLESAQGRIKELEGQVGGFTTANKQANEKLTTYEQQVKDLTQQLEAKTGELTNWTTQHGQLNEQLGQVQGQLGQTQAELNLYKTIAENPDYHNLIGMVSGIKIANTPEEQKTILDAMANGMKGHTQQMVDMFKAGGQPPAAPGGNPAPTGPKNMQEAHARLSQIMGLPQHRDEQNRLMAWITEQNGQGQPN